MNDPRLTRHCRGVTLVETITVIAVMGVLVAVAAPQFSRPGAFQARGFSEQVQEAIRFARKVAIAEHREICVSVSGSALSLTRTVAAATPAAACDAGNPVLLPGSDAAYNVAPPPGLSLNASRSSFRFDPLGDVAPGAVSLTVAGGDQDFSITVEAGTGYVH